LPAVPDPSSLKVSDAIEATSAAIVLIEFEVAATDVPMLLVAVTANVYEVPGCRVSNVKVPPPAWVSVLVIPPGVEVAVYEVITEPPFEAGAVKLIVALRLPVAVAVPIVGAPGAVIEQILIRVLPFRKAASS
jgi:hypothetical protein